MTPKTIVVRLAPSGEAPEWVRHAWVGLALPVLEGPVEAEHRELLTQTTARGRGFWVDFNVAMAVLAAVNEDAAHWWWGWWRDYSRKDDAKLFFGAEFCAFEPVAA
jgi:hypothetical protein